MVEMHYKLITSKIAPGDLNGSPGAGFLDNKLGLS